MKVLLYLLITLAGIVLIFLLITYLCFRLVFCTKKRTPEFLESYRTPNGKAYDPFREQMITWIKEARNLPQEDVSIQSYDGLTLRGKYYEYAPGAPIELMFHGYRGDAERDLCGGVQRCFSLGRNALIVNQRGCGNSDGQMITFGIKEHKDCLAWIDFMLNRFGPDVKIILTGISMGASTVLMVSGKELPPNVCGILADCGFTSAKDIIRKVMRQIHLPANVLYPLVKLGAKLFGRFDLEETSPAVALKNCKVPVIFFHGEADDFVPWEMSKQNYETCPTTKQLVIIPGADHGLSFPVQPERYLEELTHFFPDITFPHAN